MILKRIQDTVGVITGTNCYIIEDEETLETMVIDPGVNVELIGNMLLTLNSRLKYIVLTHCHGDHISGTNILKENFGGKVLIHRYDEPGLRNNDINLSTYIGLEEVNIEADSRLNDEDLLHIGEIEFKVIHTPGHTKGRDMFIL